MGGSAKIAVMWRGERRSPGAPSRYETRLAPVLQALRAAHFEPAPIVFFEEQAQAARQKLRDCAGVLVWINPLAEGRDRVIVDGLLIEAAQRGAWVSAHPDVIAKMGVKDVLYATRDLGWGSDTERYDTLEDFRARFPAKLAHGARVLKPHRGNDGQGVIKVTGKAQGFSVQFASDDSAEDLSWDDLVAHAARVLESGGRLIDQEFHLAAAGMVRCYLSFDRVIGFCRQAPRSEGWRSAFAMNSAKAMFASDEPAFGDLRESLEKDWIPGAKRLLGLETGDLPALWDADFLVRRPGASAHRSAYALCEINMSCVAPFPDVAPIEIVQGVRRWVRR